jgi:hypothetical protein
MPDQIPAHRLVLGVTLPAIIAVASVTRRLQALPARPGTERLGPRAVLVGQTFTVRKRLPLIVSAVSARGSIRGQSFASWER